MAKRVQVQPDWLNADNVEDIYSVSGCVSEDFADYIDFWKHNGYWLFNRPEIIEELACTHSIDLEGRTLFYYEAYEKQFDIEKKAWVPFSADQSFFTNVKVPDDKHLQGYDVVGFSVGNAPECSPLSCNHMAETVAVSRHCLLESFEEAKKDLEVGVFDDCEPGPYRIFAVYAVVNGLTAECSQSGE